MSSKSFWGLATQMILACVVLVPIWGCQDTSKNAGSGDPHGHHGGHAMKMSGVDGAEMEFTLDKANRRMVIYIQKSKTHQPHPIQVDRLNAKFDARGYSFDAAFTADPRSSDPEGSSSRFVFSLDELPQQLVSTNQFVLKVWYTADGKTISVTINHDNNHTHDYHHD